MKMKRPPKTVKTVVSLHCHHDLMLETMVVYRLDSRVLLRFPLILTLPPKLSHTHNTSKPKNKNNTLEDDDEEEENSEDDDEDDDEDSDDDEDFEDEDEFGKENEYDAIVKAEEVPTDEEHRDGRDRPTLLLILLLCCCCLVLIGLAVGLGVGLSKNKDDDNSGNGTPTPAPNTNMPSVSIMPSFNPTDDGRNPAVPEGEQIQLPSGDTTIVTEGPDSDVSQGDEEELRVGNGDPNDENNPPSYAIIQFTWNETGYPWFNVEDLQGYSVTAELCVTHVANEDADGVVTYSTCRLPAFLGENVESLTGASFPYTIPDQCQGESLTTFNVVPSTVDSEYCIDVTSSIAAFPPFVPPPVPLRQLRTRSLQNDDVPDEYERIAFVIANLNETPPASDRFYSRQSGDNAPELRLDIQFAGGPGGPTVEPVPTAAPVPTVEPVPTDVPGPDDSAAPTAVGGPDDSAAPTGLAPTVSTTPSSVPSASVAPSTVPSISNAPSASVAPSTVPSISNAPSISRAPSISANPTFAKINDECGVCGFDSDVQEILPIPINLNGTFRPDFYEDDTIPCDELNALCLDGFCSTQVCQAMPLISETCGCQVSNFTEADNRENCNVCGEGNAMNELFIFVSLSPGLGPPGWSDRVVCDRINRGCVTGFCSPDMCDQIPLDVAEVCGCGCNACGAGNTMTDLDANVTLPDGIFIASRNDTSTFLCSEIKQLCDDGECQTGDLCTSLPALIEESCGCVPDV